MRPGHHLMKKRIQNSVLTKRPSEVSRFSISIGGLDITRRSEAELVVLLPASMDTLQRVVVNGEVFHRNGLLREVVRIAPVKFTETHFEKVDSLIQQGCSVTGACKTITNETGFNPESFRQQYYKRHASKKRIIQ